MVILILKQLINSSVMKAIFDFKFSLENDNFYLILQFLIWLINVILIVGFVSVLKIN